MVKYLDCVLAFTETMRDKCIDKENDNHLLIVSRDETNTVGGIFGNPQKLSESLWALCVENKELCNVVLSVSQKIIKDKLTVEIESIINKLNDHHDDTD